jgi:hypothetical protein
MIGTENGGRSRPSKDDDRVAQGDDLHLKLQATLELGTGEGKLKERLGRQWKRKGSISGSDKTNDVNSTGPFPAGQ